MKTRAEIEQDARHACPYERDKQGNPPWVDGYIAAATVYEKKIEELREIIRTHETRQRG